MATKATTAKKNTTAEAAARNRAVERIAAQLDITTEETTAKLLDLATRVVDDNLMTEDEPFYFTEGFTSYPVTEELAKMTVAEVLALEGESAECKFAQRILYERHCEARGVQPEGANDLDGIADLLAPDPKERDIPANNIEIPPAVWRLAWQLDRDPGALAAEIMQAGAEALDNGLAHQPRETFDPVCFIAQVVGYSHFKDFTITGWLDRMSPELMADCRKEAEDCNQTIQQIVLERIQRGADLKLLAQPEI